MKAKYYVSIGFAFSLTLPFAVLKVMLKASYKVPAGEKLSPNHLTNFQVVEVDATYLSHPEAGGNTVLNCVALKLKKPVKKHMKKMQLSA